MRAKTSGRPLPNRILRDIPSLHLAISPKNNYYYERGEQIARSVFTLPDASMYHRWKCIGYRYMTCQVMKNFFCKSIDFSKVETLVYHLPNGPALSVEMEGLQDMIDIDMEIGDVCDTSDIDGVVHFFPRGNA